MPRLLTVFCFAISSFAALPVLANDFQDAVNASATRTSNCVYKNVATLDDRISGADVIARAVVMACKSDLDRAAEVMIYGPGSHGTNIAMLENQRNKMRQRLEEDTTSRATLAILKHRAAKAQSK